MDDSRFDDLARSLAGPRSRRGFLGGLLGLSAGLVGVAATAAACPPGQLAKRGACVCKLTGRPPVNGACPCPKGQTDTGDGQGCVACHADGDCGTSDRCTTHTCIGGTCTKTKTVCDDGQGLCTTKSCDPLTGCAFTKISCDDGNVCTVDSCDPKQGCQHVPVSCDDDNACTTDTCDPINGCVHTDIDRTSAELFKPSGSSPDLYVDDDLNVFLNDVQIYQDQHPGNTRSIPPIALQVCNGDQIRIVASDANTGGAIQPIALRRLVDGAVQELVPVGLVLGAMATFDETFTVALP